MFYQNRKGKTDKRRHERVFALRISGRDMTGKRWGCRVALDGRAVSGGMFHVLGSTWHPSFPDSMKNLFRRPWWRVWEDFWAWVGIIWLSRSSAAASLRLTLTKISDMYNIAVQIYIGKTIFTYTAKVDLVLCTQQQRVNDRNLKSVSEKWHICMKDKQI